MLYLQCAMKQSCFSPFLFLYFRFISVLENQRSENISSTASFILKKCDSLHVYDAELNSRQRISRWQHVASVGVIINVAWLRRCRSWQSIQPIRVDLSRLDQSTHRTHVPIFPIRSFLPTRIPRSGSTCNLSIRCYTGERLRPTSPETTFFRLVN